MRHRSLLSLLATPVALSALLVWPTTVAGGGWVRDVDQALQVARSQQRPVLLFVSMDNCKYCRQMAQMTLRDPEVAETIRSEFVPAVIKNTERPDLMRKLGIRSFPVTLVVSPNGQVVQEMKGYVKPDKFQQQLEQLAGEPARTSVASNQRTRTAQPAAASPFRLASTRRPAVPFARPKAGVPADVSRRSGAGHRPAFAWPFGLDRLFGARKVRR